MHSAKLVAFLLLAVLSVTAEGSRSLRGLADASTELTAEEFKALADDEKVQAKFLGNLVGNAKMLCTVIQAIDCWQNNPKLPIPEESSRRAQEQSQIGEALNLVGLLNAKGEMQFADGRDLMKKVQGICKFVDKGVGALPDLLPGFKLPGSGGSGGGWLDKLPWLGGLIGRGNGGAGKVGNLFDFIFGSSTQSAANEANGKIALYNFGD